MQKKGAMAPLRGGNSCEAQEHCKVVEEWPWGPILKQVMQYNRSSIKGRGNGPTIGGNGPTIGGNGSGASKVEGERPWDPILMQVMQYNISSIKGRGNGPTIRGDSPESQYSSKI